MDVRITKVKGKSGTDSICINYEDFMDKRVHLVIASLDSRNKLYLSIEEGAPLKEISEILKYFRNVEFEVLGKEPTGMLGFMSTVYPAESAKLKRASAKGKSLVDTIDEILAERDLSKKFLEEGAASSEQ